MLFSFALGCVRWVPSLMSHSRRLCPVREWGTKASLDLCCPWPSFCPVVIPGSSSRVQTLPLTPQRSPEGAGEPKSEGEMCCRKAARMQPCWENPHPHNLSAAPCLCKSLFHAWLSFQAQNRDCVSPAPPGHQYPGVGWMAGTEEGLDEDEMRRAENERMKDASGALVRSNYAFRKDLKRRCRQDIRMRSG